MPIRRIESHDAQALLEFYNGLSTESKRTFRPLGETTNLEKCEQIVSRNDPSRAENYDLVAVEQNRIRGWGFVWNLFGEEPLFGLGVADRFHGRGIGGRLMDRVLEGVDKMGVSEIYLTVVVDNHVARTMYQKRGFIPYDRFLNDDGLYYYRMKRTL